jgi:hypothetical protein
MRFGLAMAILTIWGASREALATTAARPIEGRHHFQPFDIVLDVNGELFSIDVPNSASALRAEISDDDELLSVGYNRHGTIGWFSNGIVDFREELDGANVHVRFYPVRRSGGGYGLPGIGRFPMRIYAQFNIDFNDDWIMDSVIEGYRNFTTPLTAQTLTPLGRNEWLLSGIFGPRMVLDPPLTLFDGDVGGRNFNIAVREFGFSNWQDDLVITDVPEPSGLCLGVLVAVALYGSRISASSYLTGS